MYTVIRTYNAAPSLAAELKKRSKEIEGVISSVPGFIAYYLIDSTDGAASITVCENRAGCDESSKRAGEWLKQNLPDLWTGAPQIFSGEIAFKFANYPAKV